MNFVRLGVMWEAVERSEGTYDEAYLDKVETLINKLGEAGITRTRPGSPGWHHQDQTQVTMGEPSSSSQLQLLMKATPSILLVTSKVLTQPSEAKKTLSKLSAMQKNYLGIYCWRSRKQSVTLLLPA